MTSDFKDAFDALSKILAWADVGQNSPGVRSVDIDVNEAGKTIRRALLIADKVCGEPSDAVVEAGNLTLDGWDNELLDAFKAMRDEMLREIDEEMGDGEN